MKKLTKLELEYRSGVPNLAQMTLNAATPVAKKIVLLHPPVKDGWALPSLVLIGEQEILPINFAWAVLLQEFIRKIAVYQGEIVGPAAIKRSARSAAKAAKQQVYPHARRRLLECDLWVILNTIGEIVCGEKSAVDVGMPPMQSYAKALEAPLSMDFILQDTKLSVKAWADMLERCQEVIPRFNFVCGSLEKLGDREYIIELIEEAQSIVTLETDGVGLDVDFCWQLKNAGLDQVKIKLYSADPLVHNRLSGNDAYQKTVHGIRTALEFWSDLIVETPLSAVNCDYLTTLQLLRKLGVWRVSCSSDAMDTDVLVAILEKATNFCREQKMEIVFTSPGKIKPADLIRLGLPGAACGAGLTHLTIASDGSVLPCRHWSTGGDGLGKLLVKPWGEIWQHEICVSARERAGGNVLVCPLHEKEVLA